MFERILTLAIIIGGAYWYWSGPYQARNNPTYAQKLQQYQEKMDVCIHSVQFQQGVGESGPRGLPEDICAKKYNLYKHDDGRWHSFDDVRR